jgi:hypothetical protein
VLALLFGLDWAQRVPVRCLRGRLRLLLSQCASEMCERVYTRQPNGSLKYYGCTNGPPGTLVLDAGTVSDASSQ